MRRVRLRGAFVSFQNPSLYTDKQLTREQAYVDFTKSKDLVADVKAATPEGLGAHAVLLLAASEKPFQQAVDYSRPRGAIVAIGLPANAFLKAPVFESVIKMINIKGSYVGNRQDGAEAVDFFARGLIKAPFKTAPLEDLPKVFELMGKSFHDRRCSEADAIYRAKQNCRTLRSQDPRVTGMKISRARARWTHDGL